MMDMAQIDAPVIEWGTALAPIPGETESGDLPVVESFPHGALVALIDGLGHGPEAAVAARAAAAILRAHAGEAPLSLVQRCHEGLRKTRGAVMSIASLDARDSVLTWIGVGNVEGVLVREDGGARETIALRGGVVGYQLPSLRAESLPVVCGDTLVLVSDGIRADFRAGLRRGASPQDLADTVLLRHGKSTDDACVAVARYTARPHAAVPVVRDSDVATARHRVRELGAQAGLGDVALNELATAVTEVARNIVVYGRGGEIRVAAARHGGHSGVVVVATDHGPGIPDIARAMQDDFSTGGTLGLGLSSAKRLVDEFELTSAVGRGTTVTLKKWRR